jgi:hypothetical protein
MSTFKTNKEIKVLREGSTISQNRLLSEAFSYKPTLLEYDDDGCITHNGAEKGSLYIIDENIKPGEDIYMHPRTAMDKS